VSALYLFCDSALPVKTKVPAAHVLNSFTWNVYGNAPQRNAWRTEASSATQRGAQRKPQRNATQRNER
jgi:hypothetical protein